MKFTELIFLETSAKTGENVEESFLKCSKTILAKIESGELDPERTGSGIQYGASGGKTLHGNNGDGRNKLFTPDCICNTY